ncbi:MAG TPA: hypothetical protein VGL08_01195 [Paraburkholderia sp.]|jgi:hypothetical protein
MRERLMPAWLRGHCRLGLSREAVSVLRIGASRKSAPVVVDRPLPDLAQAAPDELAAQIAVALDEAGGRGLPVYATFADDLVRYFIVTPPGNSARMQDLRAAAEVRFVVLYGESAAGWQLVGDWQAAAPFLACAVSQRLHTALQLAVRTQRGCLVSIAPNFICAWNRWRRRVAADAWLATLHDGTLTLGLVASGARARLAAVRTLALPEDAPPLAWLHEQVARAALLDNLQAPSVLHLHGPLLDAWQPHAASSGDAGMAVRWCAADQAAPGLAGTHLSAAAQLAWGGATP